MRRAFLFLAVPTVVALTACEEAATEHPDASMSAQPDAGFIPPPSPKIVLFEAAADAVPRGETVELRWKVENAQRVTIFSPTEILVDSTEPEGVVTTLPVMRRVSYDIRAAGYGTVGETVDVAAIWPEPTINTYTANPMVTYVNGFTQLSWTTSNTEKVSIYQNDVLVPFTVFMGSAAEMGTAFITITSEMTTLQLRAENPTYTVTEDIVITAGPQPAILSFRASPRTFIGTSTTVTVTWETQGFESTDLLVNFIPVENFSRTPSGSVSTEIFGTTNLTLYGNLGGGPFTQADTISAQAGTEFEPNDLPGSPNYIGYEGGVIANLSSETDVDYYYLDIFSFNGATGLRAWTRGEGPGCPVDTSIEIYEMFSQNLLGSDEDDGIPTANGGACAEIDPERDVFAQFLQGSYLIAVKSQRGESGDYVLFTEITNGVGR